MKKLWKTNKQPIILSLLAAAVILAVDINSRTYFAVGGGVVMVVPGLLATGFIGWWKEKGDSDD